MPVKPPSIVDKAGEAATGSDTAAYETAVKGFVDLAFADKLFRPFQRLHTMDEYAGDGVGLATAPATVRNFSVTGR